MDTHYDEILSQKYNLDDVLIQIASLPKRRYTRQELKEARDNLGLMNDRVFLTTFSENKNNHIITGIVNALRKLHSLAPIPPIERTTVQNISLYDALGRGMIGDLLGEGPLINISVEVQKGSQAGYAVRGTISSSNIMRAQFSAGDNFTDAPDVIGINILGFRLPELKNRNMFCSRIVRAEYESGVTFLAEKYSDYYVELPKMNMWAKEELPEAYHDLWDLCCIFKAKIKEHEEVIRMQAITNPVALELADEVKKVAAPINLKETLERKDELEKLKKYIIWQLQKGEQEAAERIAKEAERAAQEAERAAEKAAQEAAEKMLIMAIQSNATPSVIETMQKGAGISDARLAELMDQAKKT